MFLQNYTYIMIKTDISIAARTTEGIYLIFLFNIAQKSEQNLKNTDERRETRDEIRIKSRVDAGREFWNYFEIWWRGQLSSSASISIFIFFESETLE